jgi:hypothetical protein
MVSLSSRSLEVPAARIPTLATLSAPLAARWGGAGGLPAFDGAAGPTTAAVGTGGAFSLTGAGGTGALDAAVDASPPTNPFPAVYAVSIAPIRKLDVVFMIDNSPAMGPKVAKLSAQLPRLFAALKSPTDGTLPDLRIALIDSDLGTGGAYSAGSCGPNDSNGQNAYGDVGNFQMRGLINPWFRSSERRPRLPAPHPFRRARSFLSPVSDLPRSWPQLLLPGLRPRRPYAGGTPAAAPSTFAMGTRARSCWRTERT